MELTKQEFDKYIQLTEGMEFEFIDLSMDFLTHVENIILGTESPDMQNFCFHFYHSSSLKNIYLSLLKLFQDIIELLSYPEYKVLIDNLSNVILMLREPIDFEANKTYQAEKLQYWRNITNSDPELARSKEFSKYISDIEK